MKVAILTFVDPRKRTVNFKCKNQKSALVDIDLRIDHRMMHRARLEMLIVLLLSVCLACKEAAAEYQFNAISSVIPVGRGFNRFSFDCGAGSNVVFKARHSSGEEATVSIACGEPVYQYKLEVVGYVPVETQSMEVMNCVVQGIPDVYVQSINSPKPLPAPKMKRGIFDFLTGPSPTQDTADEFDKIHARDVALKNQSALLAKTGQQVQSYTAQTGDILTQINNQTNQAYNNLQAFVANSMQQMVQKSGELMTAASTQLDGIIGDMGNRTNALLNQTNMLLAQFQTDQIYNETQKTYKRMLQIVRDQMSGEWSFLANLIDTMNGLGTNNDHITSALKEFRETLRQLQNHQYGIGQIARSYHAALTKLEAQNMTAFIGSRGIAPQPTDDFYMKISETDLFKEQYCGKILHLICRRSSCSWYFAYDQEGVVSSCSVSVSLDSPYREATLDGKVFAMIADQDDPQLSLLRSAAMLETQSVYGPNQTVWGTTLGDGLVTSRMYSLFDGRTFMSKCDRARVGVYKNEWVPIYRLAYY